MVPVALVVEMEGVVDGGAVAAAELVLPRRDERNGVVGAAAEGGVGHGRVVEHDEVIGDGFAG